MDIIVDEFYEQLLRFCASGKSAYTACSPCYGAHNSHIHLARGVQCLRVSYASGSHGHLEQPPNARSWEEPCVQHWLTETSCTCVHIPACSYGWDICTSWLFASSLSALASLGSKCDHPPYSHKPVPDAKSDAHMAAVQYPSALATDFADLVGPMCIGPKQDWTLPELLQHLPVKGLRDQPQAFQDGGGLFSFPDWSYPRTSQDDIFQFLRQRFFQRILDYGFHTRLVCHFHRGDPSPPFTSEELQPFRTILEEWASQFGQTLDWTIREHQPMHLRAMQAISRIMQDADNTLFDALIAGVPTGFLDDVPASNCFSIKENDELPGRQSLSIHMDNWRSSSDRPELTSALVDQEVQQGWVEAFDGDVSAAQARWPQGLAIGRLGIATSDHRDPRLVIDSSICGTNSSCCIREHQALPTSKDILRTFPLRDNVHELGGLSIDVKAAHKRIVVRDSERGLLGFSHSGKLFFYRVAPFGAVFSAHWWGRLGSFIVRLLHHAVWIKHGLWLYVDDFLFCQRWDVLPLTSTFIIILLQLLAIPISWKKCVLAKEISWIGWRFNFAIGVVTLDPNKCSKLLDLISALQHQSKLHKKDLERFIGLAMWITQLFAGMRPMLQYFYADLLLFHHLYTG